MNTHRADPLAPILRSAEKSLRKNPFRGLSRSLYRIVGAIRPSQNSQWVQRKPVKHPFEHPHWPPIVFEQNSCSLRRCSRTDTPQPSAPPILFSSFSLPGSPFPFSHFGFRWGPALPSALVCYKVFCRLIFAIRGKEKKVTRKKEAMI